MEKRWIQKEQGNLTEIKRLSEELQISEVFALLLTQRGVHTKSDAEKFFSPNLQNLHDAFLMKDMDKAVERLHKALSNKEKILVFGDYDVDGTTAAALVYSFLKDTIGENYKDYIYYYIPDRYTEGYGISIQSIEYAHTEGYTLMIALDCGIKAFEPAKLATQYGIDLIVCDHHRPDTTLPEAYAILDPKREDCEYPFKELSGCGVGFKYIQGYLSKYGTEKRLILRYLDLVAISIASDIVPITDENRILAYYGLRLINRYPRFGVESILSYGRITRKKDAIIQKQEAESKVIETVFSRKIDINDLVFLVGPRINAAGRIDTGRNSVKLVLSETKEDADRTGKEINKYNTARRSFDTQTTREAIAMIEHNGYSLGRSSIVLHNQDWHKGVIGIVASRIVEKYYRPTIIFTQANDIYTGSARSVKGFDIYDAIESCGDLLEQFGGHTYAAGLSVKPENLEKFINKFEEIVKKTIKPESLLPEIEIDCELDMNIITKEFAEYLKEFEPFGPENMAPIFVSRNVIADRVFRVGEDQNHLKMMIKQPNMTNWIEGIAFGLGGCKEFISNGKPFDVAYHVELNEWNDKKRLQLNIKDLKFQA